MKRNVNYIETGKKAFVTASAGIGFSKVLSVILQVAEKDQEVIKKFFKVSRGTAGIVCGAVAFFYAVRSLAYRSDRRADGDLYTTERMADAMLGRKPSVKTSCPSLSDESDTEDGVAANDERSRIPWIEAFKSKFPMPSLPPFLAEIMSGVPVGYEEPMLLHILSMLGAMCFSKVRAIYSDGTMHAANLQLIVEGNWGAGKGKFEQLFKVLFERIIGSSKQKIALLDDVKYKGGPLIIPTTGIGTSMSKYVDILADNQDCHMYIFNSEVRSLSDDLRKGNGLNFDFLRKAFENGDVCRNNKSKDGKNGIFPVYLNYTLTGTPADINTSFRKELEGGTLSRIAWTCIPEATRHPAVLRLPERSELEAVRDQIDDWTRTYCYKSIQGGGDKAVDVVVIDLEYVCKALEEWNDRQFELSEEENNPARRDVRLRMAAIAFHCAIVLHMLFGQPDPDSSQERKQVVGLTLFIADYCIERFLHKFGKEQNIQRKANQEAEYVDSGKSQTEQGGLVTDIATLKKLHDMKDANGNSLYGWDTLAKKSGMSASTVKRKVLKYEAEMNTKQKKNGCPI